MIRRSVRIQLLAFLVITLLGITYAGFQYVGLGNRFINKPYTVTALFAETGNIYPNAEVTLRGVQVGQVKSLDLTDDGVAVDLSIEHKYKDKVPQNARAVVANLSAVGEIYVDLQPSGDSGPFLEDGDVIPQDRTEIPLDNATLLINLDKLVNSVDRTQLAVVIDELNEAFAGSGPDLTRLIESGNSLTQTMYAALPQTIKLIDDGKIVLDTQRVVADDLRSFARDLADLSASIRQDNPDYRRLIDNGVKSAKQLDSLLVENESDLKVLLANLVTVSGIQAVPVRLNGLRTILTIYPSTIYNGFRAAPGDGKAHFGIVNPEEAQSPHNCQTYGEDANDRGYLGPGFPPRRDGADTTGQSPLGKLNAFCDHRRAGPDAYPPRGAFNAPRPPGDDTEIPLQNPDFGPTPAPARGTSGGFGDTGGWDPSDPFNEGSSSASSSSGASADAASAGAPFLRASTTYDPVTDLLLAPDGQSYLVGADGGQSGYFGANAWKWLLVAPTVG